MNYTDKQIATAKANYTAFLQEKNISDFNVGIIGRNQAEQRCDAHNAIVAKIKAGDKALEREWKLFFITEAAKVKNSKKKVSKGEEIIKKSGVARNDYMKWCYYNGFKSEVSAHNYSEASANLFLSQIAK